MSVTTLVILVLLFQPLALMITYYIGLHVGWIRGYRRARKTTEDVLRTIIENR